MNLKVKLKAILSYLNNQSIDIRIRMMFFLEYASVVVCFIGTVFMILLKQPFTTLIPNMLLFVVSFIGLYFSRVKKKYDLSVNLMIVGAANFDLPWMFFTSGGNNSGMPIWFLFSVVVMTLMARGKTRVLLVAITIIEDLACICVARYFPELVTPLIGEDAVFIDVVQSFAVVSVCLTVMLIIYLSTYDIQRKMLEKQSIELKNIVLMDALTGVYNRRAYYDEINKYKNNKSDDLVLIAMDLNGLKKINDERGHSFGDEYICVAAEIISKTVGNSGHVFRTGGDEFMVILHCQLSEAHSFEERLNKHIKESSDSLTENMAIAVGMVCWAENKELSISEIEKIADKKMYENKSAYYRRTGIDRRK